MQKAIVGGLGKGEVELCSQLYFRGCVEELFNIAGRQMLSLLVSTASWRNEFPIL